MALPTGTARGSGLSRSEAAILAWKKRVRHPKAGALDPKIAARVKQILAGKVKKGKGKAKAPGKNTPEQKNKNRADVAKRTGMGDLEGALVRVGAGMAKGEDLEPEAHNKLIEKGLAKRHADGSVTLSPAGKKWKAAADKGDADGAQAALSDASAAGADSAAKEQEKTAKKAEREKTKAAKLAERVAKQQKQQQAQKQKAQARKKIASEKAKAGDQAKQAKADANAARQKLREKGQADRAGAQAAKQKQQRKTRVLAEKIKRKEKLSASDQIDAEDAGLVKKAKKALDALREDRILQRYFALKDQMEYR